MDEQRAGSVKWGPFTLGRSYDEVGPELGRLHEARHVDTGHAALVFLLTEQVRWKLEGPWDVRLHFGPERSGVALRVDEAPASARTTELADAFVQVTAALTRVEDNAALGKHLARGTVRPWDRWASWALAGIATLALGTGVWHDGSREQSMPVLREAISKESWPTNDLLVDPAPAKPGEGPPPAKNQKRAPCRQGLELEYSGVCWVPVEQRPCPPETEAYAGRCLLPVAARQPVPSSMDAGALKQR